MGQEGEGDWEKVQGSTWGPEPGARSLGPGAWDRLVVRVSLAARRLWVQSPTSAPAGILDR